MVPVVIIDFRPAKAMPICPMRAVRPSGRILSKKLAAKPEPDAQLLPARGVAGLPRLVALLLQVIDLLLQLLYLVLSLL